ncbi:MAG: 2-C-methyl-D-erythritol 2,4-cyclodiphosphate synthase [Candidatus Omnitrophica bacterium]|nr:2-C-methyl-D-erythritol 2,4-cyclodiphosphate synthase [Candidatus Omnitrophota bacterium]
MRIGMGYDMHRLEDGRPFILGGVAIAHDKGPVGHSDGDVLLHAVCDALLGAIGEDDIGAKFPDTDPSYSGIASSELLREVMYITDRAGYRVHNLDTVVVLEKPRIGPYRHRIIGSIADMLMVPAEFIAVKAKTAEGLGDIGRGEAVSAYATVLLKET